MVRATLRLDMQNSSQGRRRNSAPEGWRNSAPPPPKPRGGRSALAGGEGQAGKAPRPGSPDTLSLRGKPSAKRAMGLLALPPADHVLVEKGRGPTRPFRRTRASRAV